MLTTGMALKEEPYNFICQCTKAWSVETGQVHIESVGLTGDGGTSTKHIQDALEGHCRPRNNEILAAHSF